MQIIRGATTILKDTKEEISLAVKELLDEIFSANSLRKEDVRGLVFSLTTDIHSFHPAKAARECGYDFAPLFACTEPEIEGGLKLCMRAMVLVELDNTAKNRDHKGVHEHTREVHGRSLCKQLDVVIKTENFFCFII